MSSKTHWPMFSKYLILCCTRFESDIIKSSFKQMPTQWRKSTLMPTKQQMMKFTFTSLTCQSIVVIPWCFIPTDNAQFLSFALSGLRSVSGPLTHSGHDGTRLLHLILKTPFQRSFPHLECSGRRVPLLPAELWVTLLTGVVRRWRYAGFCRGELHAGIAGEGHDLLVLQQRTVLLCQNI